MNKQISLDVAKEMVERRFEIWTASGSFAPFGIGDTGNGYEITAPRDLRDNIVEIEGVYEDYNETESTIALRTQNGIELIMPVGNTVYSSSISSQNADEGSII